MGDKPTEGSQGALVCKHMTSGKTGSIEPHCTVLQTSELAWDQVSGQFQVGGRVVYVRLPVEPWVKYFSLSTFIS